MWVWWLWWWWWWLWWWWGLWWWWPVHVINSLNDSMQDFVPPLAAAGDPTDPIAGDGIPSPSPACDGILSPSPVMGSSIDCDGRKLVYGYPYEFKSARFRRRL
ncbi:hypothetical protein T484DRAFT_1746735 [Baffinella frigidus]|nr:hypothetical protein T484DRAFT_1746735 [Cryptophyta sp. CCMP2293]